MNLLEGLNPEQLAAVTLPHQHALILAGAITAGVLIWRDRTSSWQTVVAGLVLAVMIAFSGHDDWLMVIGLILVAVTFLQAIWSDARRLHASRPPQPGRALTT